MHKIDLNCDLGESFGNYKLGLDDEVIKYISSANIACGFHASDPLVMQKTVALRGKGVRPVPDRCALCVLQGCRVPPCPC